MKTAVPWLRPVAAGRAIACCRPHGGAQTYLRFHTSWWTRCTKHVFVSDGNQLSYIQVYDLDGNLISTIATRSAQRYGAVPSAARCSGAFRARTISTISQPRR